MLSLLLIKAVVLMELWFNNICLKKLFTGSLIKHQLVTHLTLGIALRAVLDALRKPADSKVGVTSHIYLFPARAVSNKINITFYCRCLFLAPKLWNSLLTDWLSGHSIAIIFCKYLIYAVLIQSLLPSLNERLPEFHQAIQSQM